MKRNHMNYPVGLAVYVFEEQQKISVNTMIVDSLGEKFVKNNWTLDILNQELLVSIINQVVNNHNHIEMIYLSIPDNYINKGIIEMISTSSTLKIFCENDLNTVALGYTYNNSKKNQLETTIAIYLPSQYAPRAGVIIDNCIYKGSCGSAGEIKTLLPHVNWKRLSTRKKSAINKVVFELLAEASDLFSPGKIVLFSTYFDEALTMELSSLFDIHIELKSSYKDDFEDGMAYLIYHALNLEHRVEWG